MTDTRTTEDRNPSHESIESRRSGEGMEEKLLSRREFLADLQSSAVAFGVLGVLSPAGWAAADGHRPERLRVFSQLQAATYAAWGDVLASGAAKAGVAQFVDKYLAEPYADSLLLLRYVQNPPFEDFYTGGIAGIDQESRARFSRSFLELQVQQRNAIVDAAATSTTIAWTTPNPNFFYFVSRSDAVDVVYGTVDGFSELGIPYLPHIRPPYSW